MKYTKKPVEIEAVQWTGHAHSTIAIESFMGGVMPEIQGSRSDGNAKLLIPTLEGVMEASEGDWIIKGVKGEFYPCKPEIFSLTYSESLPVEEYEEPNYSSVEQLTILQEELGYKKGEISTVAMLGLVGEAGEVLDEVAFRNYKNYPLINNVCQSAIDSLSVLESYKKQIRKEVITELIPSVVGFDVCNLKAELSDVAYYLNILATNIGLTMFDLAQMAHDKVRAKQLAGGSSEDAKNK